MKKISLLFLLLILNGCEIENINYLTPVVLSYEPENIMTNSAILGGEVGSEGGKKITEYGIVWSKTEHPTVNDNKIAEGSRIGQSFKIYSIFEANTTYYYRFYAINEIGAGYGKEYSFKTMMDAPCNPVTNNSIKLGNGLSTIAINDVDVRNPDWAFNEGNIEYTTSSYSSTVRITVQFNEYNKNPPLTGTYTVVLGDFGNDNNLSTGQAKLFIENYGGYPGGAIAKEGTKFYVKNENNILYIIFCDTPIDTKYVLNGKFSYTLK
ncbi:hypothetical protein AR687_16900 [Flavobacteriaceae bacterium CRH]|nr:hypothetical protein AR687_16900 [Flavobacteriaceae bacterium CRH]